MTTDRPAAPPDSLATEEEAAEAYGGTDDATSDCLEAARSGELHSMTRYRVDFDVPTSDWLNNIVPRSALAHEVFENAAWRSVTNRMGGALSVFEGLDAVAAVAGGRYGLAHVADELRRASNVDRLADSLSAVGLLAGARWEVSAMADLLGSRNAFRDKYAALSLSDAVERFQVQDHALEVMRLSEWAPVMRDGLLRELAPKAAIASSLHHELDQWEAILDRVAGLKGLSALPVFESSALVWSAQVARATITESTLDAAFSAALLHPVHTHARFAERTAQRLARARTDSEQRRLLASLHLANDELLRLGVETDIEHLDDASDECVVPPPSQLHALFHVQRELLVASQDIDEISLASAVDSLVTYGSIALAHRLIDLVEACNQHVKLKGAGPIFKTTARVEVAKRWLPLTVAVNQARLGDVVDHLYFLLYEGAGAQKLRFMEGPHGVLKPEECEPIWTLKSLRNKWLRHDVEHGQESEIRRSYRQLADAFQGLGLDGPPAKPAHYYQIQNALLAQLVEWLERLLAALLGGKDAR